MKITAIETISVRVPIKPDMTMITAHGKHAESHYVLIRVKTDRGLIGLGEATVGPRWNGETGTSCKTIIDEYLAPAVVGMDAFARTLIREKMDEVIKLHPFAKSAIEMALWDIAGKAWNVPVYQLLGGAVRKQIPIKMVVGAFPPEAAMKLAERFLDSGVTTLKVKVGLDPKTDLERVTAIRELAGPNIPIGIDANGGWNQSVAREMIVAMEPLDLMFIEQPIPPGNPQALAELRLLTTVPIMADESAFDLTQAWSVARSQAADIISIYPGKNGGIQPSLEVAHLAKAAGLVCHMGSNLELGIATAAMIHLAAACPTVACERFPVDILGPLYHQWDVLKEPLDLGPEYAQIPNKPGLGVELDDEKIFG